MVSTDATCTICAQVIYHTMASWTLCSVLILGLLLFMNSLAPGNAQNDNEHRATGPIIDGYTNGGTYQVTESTTGSLTCRTTGGNPLPTLSWTCYSGSTSTFGSSVTTVVKTILWTATRYTDKTCTCTATQQGLTGTLTVGVQVEILYPPSTPVLKVNSILVSTSVKVILNHTLRIQCSSSGKPTPSYTWTLPDNTQQQGDLLVVNSVQKSDKGQYTCRVTNNPGTGQVTRSSSTTVDVQSSPTPEPVYILTRTDLVFVVDVSTSFTEANTYIKGFMKSFVDNADIDSGSVRIGVLTYSTDVLIQFKLHHYDTRSDILAAIDNIKYIPERRNTSAALKKMNEAMFSLEYGDRMDVPNVAILITDGVSTNTDQTITEAIRARNNGIHIYAVGVGITDTHELEQIASKSISKNMFVVGFDDLQNIAIPILRTIHYVCTPTRITIEVDKIIPYRFKINCANWLFSNTTAMKFALSDDGNTFFAVTNQAGEITIEPHHNTSSGLYDIYFHAMKNSHVVNTIPLQIKVVKVAVTQEKMPIGTIIAEYHFKYINNITVTGLAKEFTMERDEDKGILKMNSILDIDKEEFTNLPSCSAVDGMYYTKCGFNDSVMFYFNITTGDNIVFPLNIMVYDVNDHRPVCDIEHSVERSMYESFKDYAILDMDTVCKDLDYADRRLSYEIYKGDRKGCYSKLPIYLNSENGIFYGIFYAISEMTLIGTKCIFTLEVKNSQPYMKTYIDVHCEMEHDNTNSKVLLQLTFSKNVCNADTDSTVMQWGEGLPGHHTTINCTNNTIGSISRYCRRDAVYEDPISNCTHKAIQNILDRINENGTNTTEVLDELSDTTSTIGDKLHINDINIITEIMSKINDVINTSSPELHHDVTKYMDVANNLLNESTTSIWQTSVKQRNTGAESIVENIDKFTAKVASNVIKLNVSKPNIFLKIGQTSNCMVSLQFPDRSPGDTVPTWARNTSDSARVPCSTGYVNRSYSGVLYRNISKMISHQYGKKSQSLIINAPVISFSLYPKPIGKLEQPIQLEFGIYNKSFGSPVCKFWSETDRVWKSEGCSVVGIENNVVTCKCDHLTNFAILMSPAFRPGGDHHLALSIITIIGCVFSMVCLCITIILHAVFWYYVRSARAVIHINLSCVLFVAYLVFITGVDHTQNSALCKVIAVVLHVLLLLLFFTMMVEGLSLAYMVLNPISTRRPGIPLLIGAYVLSFVVVGVSLALRFDDYGGKDFCWLSMDHGLIWAFIGPVIVVVAVNIIIIVVVLWTMFRTATMSKKTNTEKVRVAVRNIAVLTPTMGLSWIIGIFAVNEDTIMFQYVFAITNSLQGLFIFILHGILNKKIQEAMRHYYGRWLSNRSVTSAGRVVSPKISATSSI